jgi:hypothetical protein
MPKAGYIPVLLNLRVFLSMYVKLFGSGIPGLAKLGFWKDSLLGLKLGLKSFQESSL